jgi:hypothetical protein
MVGGTSEFSLTTMSEHQPEYCTSLYINSASDLTSDVYSQSESQTPGGSTTGRFQHHSADNPRRKNPTSLSYYRSTEAHAPLAEAKESFTATAFASGCFFYHQCSPYIETFQTYARDAIALANDAHNSKGFGLYHYYHCANYCIY